MTSPGKDNERSDEAEDNAAWFEDNAWLFDDTPHTLLYGAGASGKTVVQSEDYDKLSERLTSDEHEVKGVGHTLRGAEAAAYGRAMLENSVGGPEKLAELVEKLKNYRKG